MQLPPAQLNLRRLARLASFHTQRYAPPQVDPSLSRLHASRRLFGILEDKNIDSAIIHHYHPEPSDSAELALQVRAPWQSPAVGVPLCRTPLCAHPLRSRLHPLCKPCHSLLPLPQMGTQIGGLLCDGLGDGVLVEPMEAGAFEMDVLRTASFGLLQGSRMRNTKTEFVSCPSCGRTLFDLQEVRALECIVHSRPYPFSHHS